MAILGYKKDPVLKIGSCLFHFLCCLFVFLRNSPYLLASVMLEGTLHLGRKGINSIIQCQVLLDMILAC